MTKDEFIAGMLDAGFYDHKDALSYSLTEVNTSLNYFYLNNCASRYKYTQANLDELINAAKVYERLERV